jgi:hypothetical protein
MQLTPMHQLLDWFKDQTAPTKDELELKILELADSEKSVIIDSVNDTINVFVAAGFKDIKADAKTDLGEIYYKEKFNEYEQKF